MRRALALVAVLVLVAACSPPVHHPAPPLAVHITASEHVPGGARLVVIGEHGEREAELVPAAAVVARDSSPVISPDGAWVAFVSSRGRDMVHTSLWVAANGTRRDAAATARRSAGRADPDVDARRQGPGVHQQPRRRPRPVAARAGPQGRSPRAGGRAGPADPGGDRGAVAVGRARRADRVPGTRPPRRQRDRGARPRPDLGGDRGPGRRRARRGRPTARRSRSRRRSGGPTARSIPT